MPQKPKLNFAKGNTYTVTLTEDEPKTGTNRYGPWYLYTVRYEGQECVFFTKQDTHRKIQGLGVRTGDELVVGVDHDGKWNVGRSMSDIDPFLTTGPSAPAPNPVQAPQGSPVAPQGQSRQGQARKTFQEIVEDYTACIVAAVEVCTAEFEAYSNDDVRSIATTLYIQGERAGVEFPKG